MRFLIDADLPRSSSEVIRRHGHEAVDVRDVSPSVAKDPQIARYAQSEGLCLITGDYDFADLRNYPPDQVRGYCRSESSPHCHCFLYHPAAGQLLETKRADRSIAW